VDLHGESSKDAIYESPQSPPLRDYLIKIKALSVLSKIHTILQSKEMDTKTTRPKEHIPPPITREDFQIGHLKPCAYSVESISEAIVDHLKRTEYTAKQKQGIDRFKHHGTFSLSDPQNIDDIWKFFSIFNDVFFNGVLTGYCDIEAYEDTHYRNKQNVRGECSYPGNFTRDPRFVREKPHAFIGIIKQQRDEYITTLDRVQVIHQMIFTLLHEMLHAIFVIYGCMCENGCEKKMRFLHVEGPWKGHFPEWIVAANAITQADSYYIHGTKAILGLSLDIRSNEDFARAVHAGINLPTDPELRRLGIDVVEVIDGVKILREQDQAGPRDRNCYNYNYIARRYLPIKKLNTCLARHWTVDSSDGAQLVKYGWYAKFV
jgi:hypothetical protein